MLGFYYHPHPSIRGFKTTLVFCSRNCAQLGQKTHLSRVFIRKNSCSLSCRFLAAKTPPKMPKIAKNGMFDPYMNGNSVKLFLINFCRWI